MTNIDVLRQKMNEHIITANSSQTEIARKIDVSKGTLSQFLSDKYPGDNEDIARRIQQYFDMQDVKKGNIVQQPIVQSFKNTQEILNKISIAHATNGVLLLSGAAGTGKTTAIKLYCEKHTGVLNIEADVVTNTPRAILTIISDAYGIRRHGATSEWMRKIISRLSGTDQLIVIDEAQHLTHKAIEALRAINDKAGVGIVYSGNPAIKEKIDKRDEFDQVQSRIDYRLNVFNYYSKRDIDGLFTEVELDKNCLGMLRSRANQPGGLRTMMKQYRLARVLAAAHENEMISVNDLHEAAVRMGLMSFGGAL